MRGAEVKVEMQRHAFGFGTAVRANLLLKADDENARIYRQTVTRLFNKVVFENDLKWNFWEMPKSRETTFRALKWLQERSIKVRGHVLIWPSWEQTPPDLKTLQNDRAALRKRIEGHIREEVSALRGQLVDWDVVNEPYTHHDVLDVLGEAAMTQWFRAARESDPTAALFINDFGILTGGGADLAHQAHYEKTIQTLVDRGAPLDGIGFQGHFGGVLTPPEKLLQILDRYARFGKELQITEFDIRGLQNDEQLQADYTRDLMTVFFSHPAATSFTMWGFWGGAHWMPDAEMFRKDWTPKPNALAYQDLVLKEWWTDVAGTTDEWGEFQTRGFCGDYQVTATHGGKVSTLAVPLSRESSAVTLVLR